MNLPEPLQWPKLLQIDPWREFMGSVYELLASHYVSVRRGIAGAEGAHCGQAIAERFNGTLTERLFAYQYTQEMRFGEPQKRIRGRVNGLPDCLPLSQH